MSESYAAIVAEYRQLDAWDWERKAKDQAVKLVDLIGYDEYCAWVNSLPDDKSWQWFYQQVCLRLEQANNTTPPPCSNTTGAREK